MFPGTRSALIALIAGLLAALLVVGCHKAAPPDAVCSYEPLPASSQIASGQGAIEAVGSSDTYFVVRDATGKQIASEHVNAAASLPPGDYQVVLNNSSHATSSQAGMLTKCVSGMLLVDAPTDEYYAVLNQANQQLATAHVSSPVSVFPGTYTVRLNNSDAPAKIDPGAVLELKAGTVNVNAGTDEYYAVLDAATRQLASSHMGRAISLFAGGYTVRVNNSDEHVDVRPGESSNGAAGTLMVHGATDEYYAVVNNAGVQLASAHLERPLALVPGSYKVKVNNTTTPAVMTDGATTEIKTGTVLLRGSTDEYYAITDPVGIQLATAHLGHGLSLVPGSYRAKLNNVPLPVQVDAGHTGEYQAGSLLVKASGLDYYAVLDPSGVQLTSKQVNQPVSLPAGKYSVKLGSNTRPAALAAGQNVVLNW